MDDLHPKQRKLLELLKTNIESPLSIKDLSEAVDIYSPGVLYHHLRQLEKKGYLKRNPDNSKDYVVLDSPEKSVTYIKKYGLAQCGPEGLILDGNIVDRIPIASNLLRFSVEDAFIVEANGDSMEPKIYEGDIVIAKKQDYADVGNIIVCINEEAAMIKEFQKIGERIVLHSLNIKHKLIEPSLDFRVVGVVKNILGYH